MRSVSASPAKRRRCGWVGDDSLYVAYHDDEWGVPSHDDRHLFEMLVLEGYREAFENFDAERVARFTPARVGKLMKNPAIVRNRAKIESAVANARAVRKIRDEHGSLDRFLWSFVGGRPKVNRWTSYREAPAQTPESGAMSKALLARGCRFVGPTICYAFMQATGMVDDHEAGCWRRSRR
jgi:DNA-3-methyladenine glycosylase I